jgi:hypothetical protein
MLLRELVSKLSYDIDLRPLEKLQSDLEGVKALTKESFQSLNKVADGIQNIGKKLSMYLTVPIVGLGTVSVMAQAEMEKLQVPFRSLISNTEDMQGLFEQLDKIKMTSVFNEQQVYEYGLQLTKLKMPLKEIPELIRKVGNISLGDPNIASNMIYALGRAKSFGMVDARVLRAMGPEMIQQISASMGVSGKLFMKELAAGFVSYGTLMQAVDKMALQRKNAMVDQINTLDGLFNIFRKSIDEVRESIGKWLIEDLHLKDALKWLIDKLQKFKEIIDNMPKGLRTFILIIAMIAAAAGPVLLVIGVLGHALIGVGMAIFALVTFGPIIAAVFGAIAGGAIAVLTPIILLLPVFAALFAIIQDVYYYFKYGADSSLFSPWYKFWEDMGAKIHQAVVEVQNFIRWVNT